MIRPRPLADRCRPTLTGEGRSSRVRKSGGAVGPAARDVARPGWPATLARRPSAPRPNTPEVTPDGDGWIALFDGSSTAALRGYGQDSFPPSWDVRGRRAARAAGQRASISSPVTHTPTSSSSSTGGWVRPATAASSTGSSSRDAPSWTSGPEYQVLDDDGHPDGRDPRTSAAALYGLIAPNDDKRLEPVGTLQHRTDRGRSTVMSSIGSTAASCVEYDWGGADVRALVAASKFATEPAFMSADAGGDRPPAPRRGGLVPERPDPPARVTRSGTALRRAAPAGGNVRVPRSRLRRIRSS